MKLWDAVCQTDPAHTKTVDLGRKFTAIDPMYQIMNATKQFGAAGQGWGWEVTNVTYPPNDTVGVCVRLWHGEKGTHIEQWGQCGLYIDKAATKKDSDCLKKATTDGLTKCLSYLGFNADVFFGRFDDNKYVEEMRNKFSDPFPTRKAANEFLNPILKGINECDSMQSLEVYFKAEYGEARKRGCTPEQLGLLEQQKDIRKGQLEGMIGEN